MTTASTTSAPERFPGFDILRIIAAGVVIISHSTALVGSSEPTIYQFGVMGFNLGGLAVATFFVLSGFLISASWRASPSVRSFTTKRVFRIWPALAVVILICALVLGPIVTTLSTARYFSSHLTWHYIGANLTMHPTSYLLPGVFAHLPYPIAVNGPLWTLPYEVTCYAIVLLLGVSRLLRRGTTTIAAFLIALVVATYWSATAARAYTLIPGLLLAAGDLAVLAAWFLAGAVLQRYHARIGRGPGVVAAAVVVLVVGRAENLAVLMIPAFAFLVVRLGTSLSGFTKPRWMGDPSYGMYLWGWPIQQTLMLAGAAGTSAWLLSIEALPLSVLAGIASWHLVEARSITLGRRLQPTRSRRPDRAPVTGPETAATP